MLLSAGALGFQPSLQRTSFAQTNKHCRPCRLFESNLELGRSYVAQYLALRANIRPKSLMVLVNRNNSWSLRKSFHVYCSDQLQSSYMDTELPSIGSESVEGVFSSQIESDSATVHDMPNKRFKNRFLTFVRFGSVVNDAAEAFFKSEIRRRLFVTAVLIIVSRIGYFIPLPGFDRRLMPEDYLSFASGSVDELGNFSGELKLSLFQLGISPQIAASILMQVLCHVLPSLVKLRKEGLDGHEKIKGYMCV